MSRIGNKIVHIPAGTTVQLNGSELTITGPKGTLKRVFNSRLAIEINGSELVVKRPDDSKVMKEIHGTTRALINNMIVGVSDGFKKILDIVGIGYRAQMQGANLLLHIGYSHEVTIVPDEGAKIITNSNTEIVVEGMDRQAVGQTAARIRAVREPEPYKGKGIKYRNEHILRKEGKRSGKK